MSLGAAEGLSSGVVVRSPLHVAARSEHPAERVDRTVVVLVEPDPYLAFLVRMQVPEAMVVEVGADDGADALAVWDPALVVLDLDKAADLIAELLDRADRPKVLAVVDGSKMARTTIPSELDGLLARPFVPAELNRAVRSMLGLTPGGGASRTLARARSWVAPARLGGVAIAAVLELAGQPLPQQRALILALAFVYATVRWVLRRDSRIAEIADVVIAMALVASTGGLDSNYVVFAAVVTAAIGLSHGPRWGATAGLAVVAGSTHLVINDLSNDAAALREVIAWFLLFPMIGLAGGFAARVWRVPAVEGLALLVEANRVLSSLYRIARTLPGGLELGSVAEAAIQEVREVMRAPAGALLVSQAGSLVVVGSYGLHDPELVGGLRLGAHLHGPPAVLLRDQLDSATSTGLGDNDCWIIAPMLRDGVPLGALLAACPGHEQHEPNRHLLHQLADEIAMAVENAQLFSRVREISIDEERRRLARELHDGVAQALTHLRYELDFIGRHSAGMAENARKELSRLSRVAERAASDVRSMIMGLRASVSGEGLAGAIGAYVRDLRSLGGPEIAYEARGEARLRPDIENEIFRIAQEAVSNALRHASARVIRVRLLLASTRIELEVEDDGLGVARRRADGRKGVGLQAMRERAELIGATLSVGGGSQGGTRVRLDYMTEERA